MKAGDLRWTCTFQAAASVCKFPSERKLMRKAEMRAFLKKTKRSKIKVLMTAIEASQKGWALKEAAEEGR